MTTQLSDTQARIRACLEILHKTAAKGMRAKPTVAELNELVDHLTRLQEIWGA